jgi:DNA-binding response OmpR family regulator
MAPYTLLLVARTQSLANQLQGVLGPAQYVVRWAPSTSQALRLRLKPSLVILDRPSSGGARSSARLQSRFGVPLLALSQPDQPELEGVAYRLSHPIVVDELSKWLDRILIPTMPHIIRLPDMWLDVEARLFHWGDHTHVLRPIGCRILAELMQEAGETVPRDDLFRRVWHLDDGDNTRALDVHVSQLRRQVEADPRRPRLIRTVRGVGYRLEPSESG